MNDAAIDSAIVAEARNLCRVYRKGSASVVALNNVNLRIDKGDFIAIMGPSGSGKSTLMHILGLLDQPTSGTYQLLGRDTLHFEDDELSRMRGEMIGFVFQQFSLIEELDVQENVALPFLYQQRKGESVIQKRARTVLEKVGLGQRMHHRPSELSGGEMQRVAIARALVTDPAILLADEPTGNLDRKTGEGIVEMLQGLNESGVTVLTVTHSDVVAAYARRRLWIVDGQLHE